MVHEWAMTQTVARATVGSATGGISPTCSLIFVWDKKASRRERACASSPDAEELLADAGIVDEFDFEKASSAFGSKNSKGVFAAKVCDVVNNKLLAAKIPKVCLLFAVRRGRQQQAAPGVARV